VCCKWLSIRILESGLNDYHVGRIKEHGNRALRVAFDNSASPVRTEFDANAMYKLGKKVKFVKVVASWSP
jgi:hypothetical protein